MITCVLCNQPVALCRCKWNDIVSAVSTLPAQENPVAANVAQARPASAHPYTDAHARLGYALGSDECLPLEQAYRLEETLSRTAAVLLKALKAFDRLEPSWRDHFEATSIEASEAMQAARAITEVK